MGVVRDPGDSVVLRANAELRLQDAPRTIFSLRTDDEGKFKFTVLPPGTFTLTVESKRSCRHSGLISSAGL